MDHAAFPELIAGRLLGDLDSSEQRTVDTHLPSCASCRALSHDLDGVLTDLACAAPVRRVPPVLGASVMAAIHRAEVAAAQLGVPVTPPRTGSWAPRPKVGAGWLQVPGGLGRLLGVGLGVAAAVAIAVLGIQVLDLREQVDAAGQLARAASAELATRETAMQVVADPAHASAWLQPSTGETAASALMVYLPGSTAAYLMADGLPATPDGRVYQFWYADDAGVHPGVTFQHDGQGVLLIPVQVDLGGAQAAMLTIESAGGASGGPSQDIVFGELPPS